MSRQNIVNEYNNIRLSELYNSSIRVDYTVNRSGVSEHGSLEIPISEIPLTQFKITKIEDKKDDLIIMDFNVDEDGNIHMFQVDENGNKVISLDE